MDQSMSLKYPHRSVCHHCLPLQLEQAAVLRKEAAADREMATLLKQRAISEAAGGCTAEGGDAGARPLSGAALGLKAAFGGRSLRDVLGLQGSSQVLQAEGRSMSLFAGIRCCVVLE
eukprot:1144923-Pelagomonas_calceolata.AAC.7